jgi:hypothetical protein
MNKLLLTLSLALAAIPAMAGNWTVQSIGPFDYYHSSNGQSYTGQRIGQFQYWND